MTPHICSHQLYLSPFYRLLEMDPDVNIGAIKIYHKCNSAWSVKTRNWEKPFMSLWGCVQSPHHLWRTPDVLSFQHTPWNHLPMRSSVEAARAAQLVLSLLHKTRWSLLINDQLDEEIWSRSNQGDCQQSVFSICLINQPATFLNLHREKNVPPLLPFLILFSFVSLQQTCNISKHNVRSVEFSALTPWSLQLRTGKKLI